MTVTLMDLRDQYADPPDRLQGGVVVLDDADTLLKHADIYQALISEPMITGVVCVAMGEVSQGSMVDGVVLTLPRQLRPDGEHQSAILWVGDTAGIEWAPQGAPRFADDRHDPLADLVAVLQVPDVFNRVLAAVGEMPGAVASPGIRLVLGPADPAALTDAGAAAARSLCGVDGGAASRSLAAAARQLDAEHDPDGPQLSPPVAAAARDAQRRLGHVRDLARALGSGWALFGTSRPTAAIGTQILRAGQTAENYRRGLVELLNRMDGHLEEGHPGVAEVMELGVPEPRAARGREIAAELRRLVDGSLNDGVALPVLAQELRVASAFSGPQGVGRQLEQARRLGIPAVEIPAFPRWPLSLVTLPLIALTCAAMVVLAGPGTDGLAMGALLGAVWSAAGWLLLARRPGRDGERGAGASAGASLPYWASAAAGAGLGLLVARSTDAARVPYPMPALAALAAFAVAVALLGWRAAARRWSMELPITGLNEAVATLDRITAEACVREWQPMRRRRAVAAMTAAVAGGIDAIRETLAATDGQIFPAPRHRPGDHAERMVRAVPQELFDVVRGDLVELCRASLEPVWAAAETARWSDGDDARQFQYLLDDYRAHVARHGLMSAYTNVGDLAPRDALMARAWASSPAARTTLRLSAQDEMTQLCDSRQLSYLRGAVPPRLIRFAPDRLARVLERSPADRQLGEDSQVMWTPESEYVGAVRLLPLRTESIRYGWDGAEQ